MFGSEPLAGTITDRPTGMTSGGRVVVAPVARVERPRERSRRVVADDRPRLDAPLLERRCLELRVLVHAAREGPRERDDDADLHAGILRGRPQYTRPMEFPEGLAELHTHLGGSVASEIMWSLAHEQGIALPVKDYWEFDRLVTVSDPRGVENLDALNEIYRWTELIQSSPLAVERSVHAAIGGAYRSQGITTLEIRFNPMKRNRGGERDLDHIILAAIRGLDLAGLEYPQVRAGLILMMDRTFTDRQNAIVVEKAISWARARRRRHRHRRARGPAAAYDYAALAPLVEDAREAGLGVTIHVGEEGGGHGLEETWEVVETLRPERIGHGILASGDAELMAALREAGIVLEVCPTSNLLTKALAGEDALRETFRAFVEHDVPFTIATDGPEMMRTHLRDELELLLRIGALDEDELHAANTPRPRGELHPQTRSARGVTREVTPSDQ